MPWTAVSPDQVWTMAPVAGLTFHPRPCPGTSEPRPPTYRKPSGPIVIDVGTGSQDQVPSSFLSASLMTPSPLLSCGMPQGPVVMVGKTTSVRIRPFLSTERMSLPPASATRTLVPTESSEYG